MKTCLNCGEEVRDTDVIFHQCAPSTENGEPIAEQKFEFVDLLTEWFKYCIFTNFLLPGPLFSHLDEENKFDIIKWLLYNTTTIMIPIWLLSLLMSKYFLGELGEVFLVVLISPPFLIWFTLKLKLKGKNTYAFLLSLVQILILWVVINLFWNTLLGWSS